MVNVEPGEIGTLLALAMGKYASKEEQPEPAWSPVNWTIMPNISNGDAAGYYFHGELDSTDAPDQALFAIVEDLAYGNRLGKAVFYLMPQYQNGKSVGNNIALLLETIVDSEVISRRMFSGMTDYSGAGRKAFSFARSIVETLATIYGVRIEYEALSDVNYLIMVDRVNLSRGGG